MSAPDICRNSVLEYDLYRIDPENGGKRRLTRCQRYISAAWMPDGSILAVRNELGRHSLQHLDRNGRLLRELWRGDATTVLGAPDIDDDGGRAVMPVWRAGEGWNLELFNLSRLTWQTITGSSAIERDPRFVDHDRAVMFAADFDGIYNIYRLDLQDGTTRQLTNVVGGAFSPSRADASSPLFYVSYSGRGYDISRIDEPSLLSDTNRSNQVGASGIAMSEAPPVVTEDLGEYSPWQSLMPTSWLPHLLIGNRQSEYGLYLFGNDVLNRHNFNLQVAMDTFNNWPVINLNYYYDRYLPLVLLGASITSQSELDSQGTTARIRRINRFDVSASIPRLSLDEQVVASAGISWQLDRDGWLATGIAPVSEYRDGVAGLALSFDSTDRYPLSISNSDGRRIMAVAEAHALPAGEYSGQVVSMDWREMIGTWGEQVLAVRGVAGFGFGHSRPFRLGGAFQNNSLPGVLPSMIGPSVDMPFNRRAYNLRGYADGLPQLTGDRMALASLEYRLPLSRIERGFMAPPVGIDQIHTTLFAESGAVSRTDSVPSRFYSSIGAEFHFDLVFGYQFMLPLTVGVARGLDPAIGGDHIYISSRMAF